MRPKTLHERRARAEKANELIAAIAGCGRRFFRHEEQVARMEVDRRGRVWFVDHYTQARMCTNRKGYWARFTGGGTLRGVIERLHRYIMTGERLPAGIFGPWPRSVGAEGDLWGYGGAMQEVRDTAVTLRIISRLPLFAASMAGMKDVALRLVQVGKALEDLAKELERHDWS